MFKNVPGQHFLLFAFDSATGLPKTGDAANITPSVSLDGAAPADLATLTVTELDATKSPGYYRASPAQAETKADTILVTGRSATSGVVVVGSPAVLLPEPGILWEGTLAAIAAGSVTLPAGNGVDHAGNFALVLTGGVNASGRSRLLEYSGTGEVWNVDPAWNSDGETTPSGTLTGFLIPAPKNPTAVLPTVALDPTQVAGAVLDAAASSHNTANTIGAKINSAASAGDPLTSTVPGTYGAGTAGKVLGDLAGAKTDTGTLVARLGAPAGASIAADIAAVEGHAAAIDTLTAAKLDVTVGSRLPTSGYTAPDNATIATIEGHVAAIDTRLPAAPADETLIINATTALANAIGALPSASTNATTLLDLANAIETGLTLRQAMRLLAAAEGGNTTGMDTGTIAIKNAVANSKVRINATSDASGNRVVNSTDLT